MRPILPAFGACAALLLGSADLTAAELSAAVSKALARDGAADVLLRLPPAPLPSTPAAVGPAGQRARTEQIVASLMAHAARSQAPVLAALQKMGVSAQPLWLGNSIAVRLDAPQLARIAALDPVLRVDSDAAHGRALPSLHQAPRKDAANGAIEENLRAMRVPEAWALGARGRGVVVGGQDTGYDAGHPALSERYRGRAGNHNHHWYDGVRAAIDPGVNRCGVGAAAPCDDHSHGTHTMGTALGDGGESAHIGVATEAEWIGCRNMDRGSGRPSTYLSCFQFLLAPSRLDGSEPRADLAPAITVNSWGCPPGPPPAGEDCTLDSFDAALAAAEAAGQLTVVAAGNGSPGCGTINIAPSHSPHALVVGATDNSGAIASFSLWGPVTVDGSQRMKPDLSAPGVSIRSSVPGGQYALSSGTSMATPGVAGVAALVLGANPLLIAQPQATAALLKGSSVATLHPGSCAGAPGQQSPNPMFGHGRVDALAAVNAATQLVVGPGHGGAWFDQQRPGEGWILQVLDAGTATLLWYSFASDGSGAQDWFIASQGAISGNRIDFAEVSAVRGGRFGSGFDPAAISIDPRGTLSMQFDGCDVTQLSFAGSDGLPAFERRLSRLTSLQGLDCGRPFAAPEPLRARRSGAWFDPSRAGEGLIVEALGGDVAALTWFTFSPDGRPAWLYGVGTLDDSALRIDDLRQVQGGGFGGDFDPAAVEDRAWGRLEIDFGGCDSATLRYAAVDSAWGEGSHALQRLTRPYGLSCTSPAR